MQNKIASLPFRLITHNTHWQDELVKYKGIYIYDHNYFFKITSNILQSQILEILVMSLSSNEILDATMIAKK